MVESGHALGTLCVIDHEPRQLTGHQQEAFGILSKAVVAQLELRRYREDMDAAEKLLSMCAWCRSIRTPDGDWQPLHEYISDSVPVSHGMCPDCMKASIE